MTDARVFSTTDGTKFTLSVNMLTVKRVRELCGVNVLDILGTGEQLGGYVTDDVKLLEVICAVVRPQLKELDWSDDEFFSRCNGDVLAKATDVLLDEVADFFREPRKGLVTKALAKVRATMAAMEARQAEAAQRAIDALDCESVLGMPGNFGSTSPASSASSPGASRSGSSRAWRKGGNTKTGRQRATS